MYLTILYVNVCVCVFVCVFCKMYALSQIFMLKNIVDSFFIAIHTHIHTNTYALITDAAFLRTCVVIVIIINFDFFLLFFARLTLHSPLPSHLRSLAVIFINLACLVSNISWLAYDSVALNFVFFWQTVANKSC